MITIVTKKYCPFCSAAKGFLDSLEKEYTEVEVSSDPDTYETYKQLSGMQTVPQIYAGGEPSKETLIGGYDDMMALFDRGELLNKLQ